jgi:transposase
MNTPEKVVTIGVDCHKKMYYLTAIEEGLILKQVSVAAKPEEVLKIACFFKDRRVRVVYEAGFCGYGLYRFLTGNGIECKVIPPSMVPHTPGEKHKKNDVRDSRDLALHYDILPSVAVPSEQEEADREVVRCRTRFVRGCQEQKLRIKSFLDYYGIAEPLFGSFSKSYRKWLRDLDLLPENKMVLLMYLSALEVLEGMVKELNIKIKELSQISRHKENVDRLQQISGIGLIAGMTFLTEVFNPKRFGSTGKVSSYLGLTPQEHSSGSKERFGHISKTGNARLRCILTESAWIWIRKDIRAKTQYEKLKQRCGGKRANVAMARKLGIIMWLMITRKEDYRAG